MNDYRHTSGIRAIYPESTGTRLCLLDEKREVYVYNPVNDALLRVPLPQLNGTVRGVLWDQWPVDKVRGGGGVVYVFVLIQDIFIVYDSNQMYTYVYRRDYLYGEDVVLGS